MMLFQMLTSSQYTKLAVEADMVEILKVYSFLFTVPLPLRLRDLRREPVLPPLDSVSLPGTPI
jgi:hypothetical protein